MKFPKKTRYSKYLGNILRFW